MKFKYFERTGPLAFPAVRAYFIDDRNASLGQVDAILGANAHTAPAKVALFFMYLDHIIAPFEPQDGSKECLVFLPLI